MDRTAPGPSSYLGTKPASAVSLRVPQRAPQRSGASPSTRCPWGRDNGREKKLSIKQQTSNRINLHSTQQYVRSTERGLEPASPASPGLDPCSAASPPESIQHHQTGWSAKCGSGHSQLVVCARLAGLTRQINVAATSEPISRALRCFPTQTPRAV